MDLLTHDTDPEAAAVQEEIFRRMGPERRFELALRMTDEARRLTVDGIRHRHPGWSEDQLRHELFRRVHRLSTQGVA